MNKSTKDDLSYSPYDVDHLEGEGAFDILRLKHGFTGYRFPVFEYDGETKSVPSIFGTGAYHDSLLIVSQHYNDKFFAKPDSIEKEMARITEQDGLFSKKWYALQLYILHKIITNMMNKDGKNNIGTGSAIFAGLLFGVELGALTREYYWKFEHEKAAMEGHRHMAGREAGRPAAAAKRRSIGKKRRKAVIAAAKAIIDKTPSAARNLSELARRIEAEEMADLRLKDGTYLSQSAIYKYLLEAGKDGII